MLHSRIDGAQRSIGTIPVERMQMGNQTINLFLRKAFVAFFRRGSKLDLLRFPLDFFSQILQGIGQISLPELADWVMVRQTRFRE